jgi:hypothetical protein
MSNMFTPEELAEMAALDKAYRESALTEKHDDELYERAYKEGIRHILGTLNYSDEDAARMADECFADMVNGCEDDSRYW